jgi:hypothetical protein
MLFNQYAAANAVLTKEVVEFVREAILAEIASCQKKIAETSVDVDKSEAERVGEVKLLEGRVKSATSVLNEEGSELFKVGAKSQPLLSRAVDAVSVMLDSKLKGLSLCEFFPPFF